MCGLKSRSTFTRRVGLFRPRTQEDTDLESSGRRKRRRDPKATLLDRNRRFAEPNAYSLLVPEGPKDQDDLDAYIAPTLADLLEDARVSDFFDPSQLKAGKNGRPTKNSFKKIAGWLWTAGLPISDSARLVMTYYFSLGLGERHSTSGELTYTVHPKQTTVARACGLSVRTVYSANLELARVKLIRVVQQKPKMVNGKFRRGPAKILYLPMRTLTHEECVAESSRLLAAKERLHDPTWWEKAVGIHRELLQGWVGQEHCITALRNEFARQLKLAGAPKKIIAALLPRPPE